jgi:hypothetical protein
MTRLHRFTLVCPVCRKVTEMVRKVTDQMDTVNCGDCLMDRVEIVEMKPIRLSISAGEGRMRLAQDLGIALALVMVMVLLMALAV